MQALLEGILHEMMSGHITEHETINRIFEFFDDTYYEARDDFARDALKALLHNGIPTMHDSDINELTNRAWKIADSMMEGKRLRQLTKQSPH